MSSTTVAAHTNGANGVHAKSAFKGKTVEELQAEFRRNPALAAAFSTNHSTFPSAVPWNSDAVPAVGFPSSKHKSSDAPIPPLFQPLTIRGLTLKNRIVVSPMCMYSCTDGFLHDFHLVHLGQFALGGAALVIQEATAVQANGRISPEDAGIWCDEQMVPAKRIVDFLHSQQCHAGIQLAHAGRKASTPSLFNDKHGNELTSGPEVNGWPNDVVGPSAIPWAEGWYTPRALTLEEIEQYKRDWVAAVQRVVACGYDFLEVHGAHGYLLTEFLSPTSNHRTDQYGGSFENRIRLLLEVVELTRQHWPAELPLSVRLSCVEWVDDGWQLEDTLRLVPRLLELGVDIIDTSSGGNNYRQQIHAAPGFQVPFAAAIKAKYGDAHVLTAPVGMITDGKQANDIVAKGEGDLVLLAREFLRDPHFPMRAARELRYDVTYAPQYQRAKLRVEEPDANEAQKMIGHGAR